MDLSEISRALTSGLKVFAVVDPLRLSQWAAKHFYLSAESSYVEKPWTAYWYQVAIMDAMSDDEIEKLDFVKSARTGYTKMLLAAMGYFAEHKHRNVIAWQPTDGDSDEFCVNELEPMIRDVPILWKCFPDFQAKNKNNTMNRKKFLYSVIHLKGGKAAKNYRRISADVAILDELDGFDKDVEGEGSPKKLSAKRVEGATFPKEIAGSTPKTKHLSLIEASADQAKLKFKPHVPCTSCSVMISIQWGGGKKKHGFKWFNNDANTVVHLCPHCNGPMTQQDYLAQGQHGRWIAQDGTWIDQDNNYRNTNDDIIAKPKHVAFYVWTAYSEMTTWVKIVEEYISAAEKEAAGDITEMKTFVNTTLGESFAESGEKTDESVLRARAEHYRLRTVQKGGLLLVAAVDVQDNRFEVTVYAVGRKEEMWATDYHVIDADPSIEADWDKLDEYLLLQFPHVCGSYLPIRAAAIDTGGHFTHEVYNFCRKRVSRRIFAIKGDSQEGRPIKSRASLQDVNWRGGRIKRGVKLWYIGTDTAKDLLFKRLALERPGPGYIHFSKELPDEFFSQMTAEERIKVKTSKGDSYRWVKTKARNEAWDCTVYCIFVCQMLDLYKYTEKQWDMLETEVQPRIMDMFNAPLVIYEAPVQTSELPQFEPVCPVEAKTATPPLPEPKLPEPAITQIAKPKAKPQSKFAKSGWSERGFK